VKYELNDEVMSAGTLVYTDAREEEVAEAALLQETAILLSRFGNGHALVFSEAARKAIVRACAERIEDLALRSQP